MKKLLLLFIFCSQLFAQNDFKLDFDYAQFRLDSASNYLEIYYSFNEDGLTLINEDGQLLVKAIMQIQIQNMETNELVVNKNWALRQEIQEESGELKQKLLGAVGFILKEGSYVLTISVEDELNASIRQEYIENINVDAFYRNHFVISDIELASRIINENANEKSIFYKNTLEVFPNPSIVYSNKAPMLFYYAELYNLLINGSEANLELIKRVYNSNNEVIYNRKKQVTRNRESIVDVGFVNLSKHPTDTYTLVLTLTDLTTKKVAASSKKFFLINPDVAASKTLDIASSDYVSSEFGVLLEEECDELFNKSKIIASNKELSEYNDLDSVNHKREFLFNFWRKRDVTPATPMNEYKNAYMARLEIANARFRTMSNPGYKTDRGQVYLKYGEPDQIDRYPNETDSKPYEIWSYNQIEGGVEFVFGDLTGFNYYELLHSTKRGEIRDPNWQRRIVTN